MIYIEFFLIVCLSVTVKWLALKTTSELTYTVSGGALNSAQSNPFIVCWIHAQKSDMVTPRTHWSEMARLHLCSSMVTVMLCPKYLCMMYVCLGKILYICWSSRKQLALELRRHGQLSTDWFVTSAVFCIGMYRISGSGWPDIRPFFLIRLRLRFRPKWYQVPNISAG